MKASDLEEEISKPFLTDDLENGSIILYTCPDKDRPSGNVVCAVKKVSPADYQMLTVSGHTEKKWSSLQALVTAMQKSKNGEGIAIIDIVVPSDVKGLLPAAPAPEVEW